MNVLHATELYNYKWLKDKYYVIHIFPNKKFFSTRQECCRGLTTEGKKVLASVTGPNISVRSDSTNSENSCVGFSFMHWVHSVNKYLKVMVCRVSLRD